MFGLIRITWSDGGFGSKWWVAEVHSPLGMNTFQANSFDSVIKQCDHWGKTNNVTLTPDLLFNLGATERTF